MEVTVVDLGAGNLGSIPNMLRRLGVAAEVTSDPEAIRRAERLFLPGVGSFDAAAGALQSSPGLRTALDASAATGVPILGICLGMQLLADSSAEGELPGLGWIPGRCERLPESADGEVLRVPHLGWASVTPRRSDPIVDNLADDARFYFAHSYHLVPEDPSDVLAVASYGVEFTAAVRRGNVAGVQFHPEKSHRHGMQVLAAFTGT